MNKGITVIVIFFICTFSAFAQNEANAMLVKVLKQQLKELKENPPVDKEDEVLQNVSSFIPPDGKFDGAAMIDKYLDSVKKNIEINTGGAYIYETEEGELRVGYIDLKTNWMSIPCWLDMNASPVISSVTDSKGKEIKMSDEKYQEYLDQGFFQNDGSFGRAYGEMETKVYLTAELQNDDYPVKLKGELWVSFPTEYSSFTFTAADTGKTVKMGEYSVTFLSMNKNKVMYRVSGPRGFSDEFNKLCTNKDGKPFNGRSGNGLSYAFYLEAKKNNFELSDSRLNQLAADIEKDGMSGNTDMLYIEEVQGSFHKITFYKVIASGEKTIPVNLESNL